MRFFAGLVCVYRRVQRYLSLVKFIIILIRLCKNKRKAESLILEIKLYRGLIVEEK